MIGPVYFPAQSSGRARALSLLRTIDQSRRDHGDGGRLGRDENTSKKRQADERDPRARPDSTPEGRDARDGGHDGRADRDPGDEDGVEQARHEAVLFRVGASRNERRRGRKHEAVPDAEESYQDDEAGQVPDQRDARHGKGDRDEADSRGSRWAESVG